MIDAWIEHDERLEEVLMGGKEQGQGEQVLFPGYEHSMRT